jgi:hypothetical protein
MIVSWARYHVLVMQFKPPIYVSTLSVTREKKLYQAIKGHKHLFVDVVLH